jgi:UDP-3-O-[3-hydroxymyristoyl] glucosamine N-acyltransferase
VDWQSISSQSINVGSLAKIANANLVGDDTNLASGASPLYEVQIGEVTLLDDPKHLGEIEGIASAIVVTEPIEGSPVPQIVAKDARQAFADIVSFFLRLQTNNRASRMQSASVSKRADVHPSVSIGSLTSIGEGSKVEARVTLGQRVSIGKRVHLMPGVVIMDDSTVGDDCTVFPNVTLYERTQVGARTTIHAGTVLGAYGFGYKSSASGHIRTPQFGFVAIGEDVELGACVTIDRGTFGSTRIGQGTKIDNQVMIGHNCQIGKHNLLCSQVGIAGSCKTGDFVVLAGQVGLKDHITLGDHVIVGAQSGVMEDLEGGHAYFGSPATLQRDQMQIMAIQRRLPELRRAVKQLERDQSVRPATEEQIVDGKNERAA